MLDSQLVHAKSVSSPYRMTFLQQAPYELYLEGVFPLFQPIMFPIEMEWGYCVL